MPALDARFARFRRISSEIESVGTLGRNRQSTANNHVSRRVRRISVRSACQKARSAVSFDHLVGAGEQRRWHIQSERLGGFQIYGEFELGRLNHR